MASKVSMTINRRKHYTFDFLMGTDGIRRTFMHDVQPKPPISNCAITPLYRYDRIGKDLFASHAINMFIMEV